jgi:hypothetical protein
VFICCKCLWKLADDAPACVGLHVSDMLFVLVSRHAVLVKSGEWGVSGVVVLPSGQRGESALAQYRWDLLCLCVDMFHSPTSAFTTCSLTPRCRITP